MLLTAAGHGRQLALWCARTWAPAQTLHVAADAAHLVLADAGARVVALLDTARPAVHVLRLDAAPTAAPGQPPAAPPRFTFVDTFVGGGAGAGAVACAAAAAAPAAAEWGAADDVAVTEPVCRVAFQYYYVAVRTPEEEAGGGLGAPP